VGPKVPASFKSDTTVDYEVGAKGRWLDGRLMTNLALYYIDWSDIQLNELVGGLTVEGNGGRATSRGAEIEVAYVPLRGLTMELSTALNRAVTNVAVPAVGAVAGDTLPFAAKFTAAAVMDYEFPLSATVLGNTGLTYAYQGSRPSSWSQDPLNTNYQMPGYGTLALRGGVTWKRYSLELRANNVTDKYAYSSTFVGNIFPNQGVDPASVLITPRTLVIEFGMKL
jgi:iron complex outermembrane recepter protein